MHDMDENRGFAVIVVTVVFILVIVYCRMSVGESPHQQRRQAVSSQGSAETGNPEKRASAP